MKTLSFTNLSKSYGRFNALQSVSVELFGGEVHALMGENGAGKSTFIKLIAGVTPADSLHVAIDDRPIDIASPGDAHAAGFRFIHQELNIVRSLSVAENILLGRRLPRRLGVLLDWKALRRQAEAALRELDIGHIDVRVQAGELGTGDRMLVKIAGALVADDGEEAPVLYVLDEPTAALNAEESEKLFAVIERLRARGAAILYVSHRMNEVQRLANRVSVLRDGKLVFQQHQASDNDSAKRPGSASASAFASASASASASATSLIHAMTGRDQLEAYPARSDTVQSDAVACSASLVFSRHLSELQFAVREGEVVGVTGLAGAGQSELLQLFLGLEKPVRGQLELLGKYAPMTPEQAWRRGVAYIPRERRSQGLMLSRSIIHNTLLPHLGISGVLASRRTEQALSARMSAAVKLKSTHLRQVVGELSGGNQQKVMFARALLGSPRLLLLDEPTRGVDVGAKFDIHTLVRELTHGGCAVLLASTDLPELLGMCDRILILHEGRQLALLDARNLTAAALLETFHAAA